MQRRCRSKGLWFLSELVSIVSPHRIPHRWRCTVLPCYRMCRFGAYLPYPAASLFKPSTRLLPYVPVQHTCIMSQPPAPVSVPQTSATTPSGSSSHIESIFDAALKSYKKKTKKDLKNHDLFKQLETCDSPAAILAVFQASRFDRTGDDDALKKWLVPTINVLYAFSETIGEGVSLVNIDSSVHLLVDIL
jgi:hypothetical protein